MSSPPNLTLNSAHSCGNATVASLPRAAWCNLSHHFFLWNWLLLLFFTKSVLFFEMVKVRSCISGRVQIAPSVPFDISENHYISSQFQPYLVWMGPLASQRVDRGDCIFEALWVLVTPCVVVSWVKVREEVRKPRLTSLDILMPSLSSHHNTPYMDNA